MPGEALLLSTQNAGGRVYRPGLDGLGSSRLSKRKWSQKDRLTNNKLNDISADIPAY
jgi:hypothetical protein